MKRINTLVFGVCAIVISLAGCMTNIDFENIDATTSIETSLALPLGSLSIRLGDVLADTPIQGVSVDKDGQYVYSDTMHFEHTIELINIDDYKDPMEKTLDLRDKINIFYPEFTNVSIPAGQDLELDFPISISLSDMIEDIENMRFDSIVVSHAQFIARIQTNDINIPAKDMQSIEITINDGFRSKNGNVISVPFAQYGFGKDIPLDLSDFHIVFMKDPRQEPSSINFLDSISMTFHFHIRTSQPLTVKNISSFNISLRLNELDYDAVYGYVKYPRMMEDSIFDRPIESFWQGWKSFEGTILPISKPSLLFTIEHGFSVPLAATLNTLNVSSYNGDRKYATFDGKKTKTFHFPSKIAMDAPYDATTIDSIRIDYTDRNGNIDDLFTIHPDKVSYDYQIGIDSTSTQRQYRITDNTHLKMALNIHVPFEFGENVHFSYGDTIRGINLTTIQLDSLLAEANFIQNVEKAELKLYLDIENWIPFNVAGNVAFFNAAGEIIQLSSMESNTIDLDLKQPEVIENGFVKTPSKNPIILSVTQDDFNKIASTDHIVVNATLKNNDTMVKLTPDAAITIKAGITADVKAIIDINELL